MPGIRSGRFKIQTIFHFVVDNDVSHRSFAHRASNSKVYDYRNSNFKQNRSSNFLITVEKISINLSILLLKTVQNFFEFRFFLGIILKIVLKGFWGFEFLINF